ncbi:MAG: hypothetical protein IPG12_03570 [Saprospiraceae bacterium]|nr:hypothetical protein [Saprospiraceae bacterium]
MKGVSYLTDESNEKVAVQIDLKKNKKLWEDFCDYTIASKRKTGTIQRLAKGKKLILKRRN